MDNICASLHNSVQPQKSLSAISEFDQLRWFVMRDLKRHNAKLPAYKMLGDMNIKVFTPMVWKLRVRQGKREPQEVPFMQDLLFVHDSRRVLDPIVEMVGTLQYRYMRGGNHIPMTVKDDDMDRFIQAVEATNTPCFYTPAKITSSMLGKQVRIIGGPLDGYEGRLQKLQGSRVKRLFVELPGLLTAAVEVEPEYIQLV